MNRRDVVKPHSGGPGLSGRRRTVMMFHEKLDIKLIRLVKENPVLYDHNHGKYMDFNEREVAWQKIGDELQRSAADCKIRWINIRDVYRRILKKCIESGKPRQKMYKYEHEVSFLRPYYKDVSSQLEEYDFDEGNDQGNDDFDDEAVVESDDNNCDEPDVKPNINRSKSSTKKKKRRRFAEAIVNPLSTSTFSEPAVPSEFDSSDPVDAFLLSIGATLKTFSPYHLNLAKSKIFSVVQEHDLQQIVQKEQQTEATPQDIKIASSDSIYMP